MADALEQIAADEAENGLPSVGSQAEMDSFLEILDATVDTLKDEGIPHLLMGGIASSCLGRLRVTGDIDVFVRPEDARTALAALADNGFETDERFPHWLFKAERDGQVVDVIFRSSGDIFLDEAMLERAVECEFKGRNVKIVSAEDMVVIKALAHEEVTPRHWFDALGIIAGSSLDWEYLVDRARRGPRRVLSLLIYAQSVDLPVPDVAIRKLIRLADLDAA